MYGCSGGWAAASPSPLTAPRRPLLPACGAVQSAPALAVSCAGLALTLVGEVVRKAGMVREEAPHGSGAVPRCTDPLTMDG